MGNSRFNCCYKLFMGKELMMLFMVFMVVKNYLWEKVNNY